MIFYFYFNNLLLSIFYILIITNKPNTNLRMKKPIQWPSTNKRKNKTIYIVSDTKTKNDDEWGILKGNSFPYRTKFRPRFAARKKPQNSKEQRAARSQQITSIVTSVAEHPDLISVPIDQVDNELFIFSFIKYRHGADKIVRISSG